MKGAESVDVQVLHRVVLEAVHRACRWTPPCNWDAGQWKEELQSVAYLAALEAQRDYDPARGVAEEQFVLSRTLSALLTYYRREWRFAQRCSLLVVAPENEGDCEHNLLEQEPDPEAERFVEDICRSDALQRAMRRLSARERGVLYLYFWEQLTDRQIAERIGIAPASVSVYKDRGLGKIRSVLDLIRPPTPS
jgi:RNA polymerase sigma factor (sigma-70 family)